MKKIITLLLLIPFLQLNAQDENDFVGSFDMEIHSYKKDKEEKDSPMTVRFWSKEDMVVVQPMMQSQDVQDVKILTDMKNNVQYTLMTDPSGKKMAMKMPRPKAPASDGAQQEDETADQDVKKTGETKTIDGHVCHKYVGSNEDGKWEAWVAEDVDAPFDKIARAMSGGVQQKKNNKKNMPESFTDGLPLESTWESTDGKEKMVMYIKDLKQGSVDEKVFDMSAYEVMEIPGMMGAGGN